MLAVDGGNTKTLAAVADAEGRTLGLALFQGANRGSQDATLVAAAAIIVALPIMIVYVFLQRSFIRGMFAGAVKE